MSKIVSVILCVGILLLLSYPACSPAYTYTRFYAPPYDYFSVWGDCYGGSSFRTSAQRKAGAVAVFCSAIIGASTATADQYFDFVTVAPESSIKAEVTIEYIGGYNQIGPGAFGGIQYQWSINGGPFHQFDIDSGLSWQNVGQTIINLAMDVFGVVVPELDLIVTLFQTLQDVGEIAAWFATEIENGNAKRYYARFSFTVDRAGQHRLGVGVRANASGAITGTAYGTVVGYIPCVELTISYPNYYGIPDFAIEDVSLSQSPRVDIPLTINLGVCNVGDGISDLDKTKFEMFYTGGPIGQLVLEKNFGTYAEFKPGTTRSFSANYTFTKRGTYLLRAQADPDREWPEPDEDNNKLEKYIYVKGHPPDKPQKPCGFPAGKTLLRNKTYRIYSSGTDPDNDPLMYLFRVRSADGTFEYFPAADYFEYEGWTHNNSVIITPTVANGLGERGVYYISVQTIDTDGLLSPWSQEELFQVWDNTPPSRPEISGLCAVYTNTTYSFTASSNDAEGDRIGYRFNWGDGTPITGWYWGTDEVTSVTQTHKYTTPGTYTLQVQARDENGSESPWGTHTVKATVYVPPPGTIEVKSNNPAASFSIYRYDELKYTGSGTYWSTSSVPAGAYYNIRFNDIYGFDKPPYQQEWMYSGSSITFTGDYTHSTGNIQVTTNNPSATFNIKGLGLAAGQNFSGSGQYWVQNNVYVGGYTIEYSPLPGYCLPPTNKEVKQLAKNEFIYFNGNYILPPVAQLDYYTTRSFVIVNEDVVEFDGSGSYNPNPGIGIARYFFNFGDSKRAYAETASMHSDGKFDGKTRHTFVQSGSFTPSLTVYDPYGNSARATKDTIRVKSRPQAQMFISPSPVILGEIAQFTSTSTDADGDAIIAYEWHSNIDGLLSTNETFSTDQLTTGVHIISLKVKDSDDLWSAPATEFLQVLEPRKWEMFKKNDIRTSYQRAYNDRLYGLLSYAPKWSFPTMGAVIGSPVTANLDGDWKNGLEIAVASTDGNLYVLDRAGNLLWARNIGASASTPAIGVLQLNGPPSIVVGSTNGVFAFDNQGNQLWQYPAVPPAGGFDSSPVIADINYNPADGKEVIIGSNDGKVYAINSNGSLRWQFSSPSLPPNNKFVSSPAVADFDPLRPGLETAIGCMDGYLYVLDTTGTLVASWAPGSSPLPIQTTPAIANLIPSQTNIVFGSDDGHVYCLSYSSGTLTLAWQYPAVMQTPLAPVRSSPAIGVVGEGGGSYGEVVFGCDNGTVYDLEGATGMLKTSFSCGSGVMIRSTCAIANIDTVNFPHPTKGDLPEVIFGATNGNLYGVSFAQGGQNLPWSPINLTGGAPIYSSPAVTDIDHEPNLEILIGGNNNSLHLVSVLKNLALIPTAEFSGNPVSGTPPLAVSFSDQSTNSPLLWWWNFGDGYTTTTQHPAHTYDSPGSYTVTLRVTNAHGEDTIAKTNYIQVNPLPVADFSHSPVSGTAPLLVNFTDQSLFNPTAWSWNFGDSGTSLAQNPSHLYSSPGVYTVSLTVNNAYGSDSIIKTACVLVNAPSLSANFSQDITSGKVPLIVHFTDLSSGNPTSWNWNFGDGSFSTAQHPVHTYTKPGNYLVSLTVSNYSGSDTRTNSVLIMVTPQTNSVMIPNVPDINQPPTQTLPATNPTNFSAPIATVNITEYWDFVIKHHNALLVNADLTSPTVAEYIGYFMDTNNCGSPHRGNNSDGHPGTYVKDQLPGIIEFVRWDATHPFDAPPATPPAIPQLKLGYDWVITPYLGDDWNIYKSEIDAGRPPLVTFQFWNPLPTGITLYNVPAGEEVDIYSWGELITDSQYAYLQGSPEEIWNLESGEIIIGHTATGVGYIENWDPDDGGPLSASDFAIVHDTWDTTAQNVGIPWQNSIALLSISVQTQPLQARTLWILYK